MAEHYARVIADEGVAQQVHQAEWQAAINTLVEHIRNGRIAAGLVAAIERCGGYLPRMLRPMVLPTFCQTACT